LSGSQLLGKLVKSFYSTAALVQPVHNCLELGQQAEWPNERQCTPHDRLSACVE